MVKRKDKIFIALSDPVKIKIVEYVLKNLPISCSKVAKEVGIKVNLFTYYLRILNRASFFKCHKEGRERIIEINPLGYEEAIKYLNTFINHEKKDN